MKTVEYWEWKLEHAQLKLDDLKREERQLFQGGRMLWSMPRKQRYLQRKRNDEIRAETRRIAAQIDKLWQRIGYIEKRIDALNSVSVFERLRKGGLKIP